MAQLLYSTGAAFWIQFQLITNEYTNHITKGSRRYQSQYETEACHAMDWVYVSLYLYRLFPFIYAGADGIYFEGARACI